MVMVLVTLFKISLLLWMITKSITLYTIRSILTYLMISITSFTPEDTFYVISTDILKPASDELSNLFGILHITIMEGFDLRQIDFIIEPFVKWTFILSEPLAGLIVIFVFVSIIKNLYSSTKWFVSRKNLPSYQYQENLNRVSSLLSELGPEKKDRLEYYKEYLSGLVESIEEDLKK